ncbi:MAG: hypothetical protein IJA05_04050 [Oscillospiraceae bacterium]|nr:hypothetical protein [Oscillospiraceae bacterium]
MNFTISNIRSVPIAIKYFYSTANTFKKNHRMIMISTTIKNCQNITFFSLFHSSCIKSRFRNYRISNFNSIRTFLSIDKPMCY